MTAWISYSWWQKVAVFFAIVWETVAGKEGR